MKFLFPSSFKEPNSYEVWSETCVDVLYNPKVDYSKLFKVAVSENPNGNFVPNIPWLIEKSKFCYKKEAKQEQKTAWKNVKFHAPYHAKDRYSIDCFPINTTNEEILATYKKLFPNSDDWKVIEC